ncbi:MAG: hypothetical protein Kow0013_06220 [Pararhodobacter sp.]
MGDRARGRLNRQAAAFVMFVPKQRQAALFGILFLAALILSRLIWQDDWVVQRDDALFVFAGVTQTLFPYWMPLPVAEFLSACFPWIVETVGTLTQTCVYAGQGAFDRVGFGTLGSWYLLLRVRCVTVTPVMHDAFKPHAVTPKAREFSFRQGATFAPGRLWLRGNRQPPEGQ